MATDANEVSRPMGSQTKVEVDSERLASREQTGQRK